MKYSDISKFTQFVRNINTCSAKFPPNPDHLYQATHLQHIHFKNLTKYQDASSVQNCIVAEHLNFKIKQKNSRAIHHLLPTILTFEMESVYTGGKREKNIKKATPLPMGGITTTANGIPYVQTDRGGQVTYHGPGQLVAYFIWDLRLWKNLTSRCFVNFIEQCSKQTIENVGIPNTCTTENTGVWVKSDKLKKISSIGLNLKRNVTSHGLSININPKLEYLNDRDFVMCGLEGFQQTSIVNENRNFDMCVENLADTLCEVVSEMMGNYMIDQSQDGKLNMHVNKIVYESVLNFDLKVLEHKIDS